MADILRPRVDHANARMPAVLSVIAVKPVKLGGAEAFAGELSRQLAERGWRSVLCFLAQTSDDVRRALDAPNVAIEVLEDADEARPATLRRFWRLVRKHRPRIVHLQFVGFVSPYPWLAASASAEQVFFTDHASRPSSYEPRRARAWKRLAARAINRPLTGVVTVSDYVQRMRTAVDLVPASRVRRIYNAVDVSRADESADAGAAFRERNAIPRDCVLVTQVSWMIPEKGVSDFLRAAVMVAARRPDVHFALVGEGPCGQEYAALANRLGIRERVTWTGSVEDPIADGVYAAADVICLLSRWQEACPFVIAEAMAHRRPVVATSVGGLPELVDDGETGYLVVPGDSAAAADRIESLVVDPHLRRRMGHAARLAAETRFDLRRNVTELLGLYGVD
jgi:glycosyltransferase involved in cell wall biosynthesis